MPTYQSKRVLGQPNLEIRYHDDGLIEIVPRRSVLDWSWLPPLCDGTGFVAELNDQVDFIFRGVRVPRYKWWALGTAAATAESKEPQEPESLFKYRQRIVATRLSFRRYVVREPSANGYFRDKFIIAVKDDGEIKIRAAFGKKLDEKDPVWPTQEEQSAIKAEVALMGWPKSISTTAGKLVDLRRELRMKKGAEPELFIFRGEGEDEILFVQERVYDKNNEKTDLPWSYWSDGKWRCMEPDHLENGLPLFGLDQLKDASRVFVHEGAKTAYHVQCMVGEKDTLEAENLVKKHPHLRDCPWKSDLSGAHVGWPGGAPNPHRVDWSPLADLPPHVQVIVVCDNDDVGEEAVTSISRRLKRSLAALSFDDRFNVGFDLADPWPSEPKWWRGPRYVGPSLNEMLEPATWATDVIPNPSGKGRPVIVLRKEFAREWVYSEVPSCFVHKDYCDRILKPEQFDSVVRPFSDAEDTGRLVIKSRSAHVRGLCYQPTKKTTGARRAERLNLKGERVINTFRPSGIVPKEGKPFPWLRFMTHLFPERRDRIEVLRFCATFIHHPEVKMLFGLLLISEEQGVGKGTLGEGVLAPLAGAWNVSFPDEQQLLKSQFNSWKAHKRLAVCHEIYSGHSRAAYDTLKSTITDPHIDVNRKNIEPYTIENFVHIVACSNSLQALHLDAEDRRWLVPRVTEKKRSRAYWHDFYQWLNGGGLSIIAWWAGEFLEKHQPVATGDPAPKSTLKQDIINESRSEGAQFAYDLGLLVAERKDKVVLCVNEVRAWVAGRRQLGLDDRRLEKPLTLRKALRHAGLRVPERRPDDDRARRFTIKAGDTPSHVVANFPITKEMEWLDLKEWHIEPAKLLPL